MVFYQSSWKGVGEGGEIKITIIFWDRRKFDEIQIAMSISQVYWTTATFVCLGIVIYGGFLTATVGSNSGCRHWTADKALLRRKSANP